MGPDTPGEYATWWTRRFECGVRNCRLMSLRDMALSSS